MKPRKGGSKSYGRLFLILVLFLFTSNLSLAADSSAELSTARQEPQLSEDSAAGVAEDVAVISDNNAATESDDPKSEASAVSAQAVAASSTPNGSGSGGAGGSAVISTPTVDTFQFTGAATGKIPILVPPGRNGIAPVLALTYSSYRKNGWLGVGWDLDVGSIQRSTKRGVDYTADDFVATAGGSSAEMVPREAVWGANYYGAKTEGAFSKYYFNPQTGGWEVTTKGGVKSYYGTTSDSRQDHPDDSSRVFKWCLDRVEDANGNYMALSYVKDRGQIYLAEILYTGHDSAAPINAITFNLIDRDPADASAMYHTSIRVITAKLLGSIDVQANGDRVRAYQLSYEMNPNSYRSVLTGVQQFGSDAKIDDDGYVIEGTFLPKTELRWFAGGDGTYSFQSKIKKAKKGVLYADVNGDGMADLIQHASGKVYTYLSIGGGLYDPDYTTVGGPGNYVLYGDVNGDGKTDLVKHDSSGWVYTYLSRGDGTYEDYKITGGGGGNGSGYMTLADVNGDGNSDLVKYDSSGWVYTLLSRGDGSFDSAGVFGGGGGNGAGRVMCADVNGDAKADLIKLGNGGWIYIYLSNGDGSYTYGSTVGGNGNSSPGYVHLADVNGDGLTDLAKHENDGMVFTFLSRGDGTFTSQVATGGGGGNGAGYIRFADVNGDGRADLLKGEPDGFVFTYISDGSGRFIYQSTTGGGGANGPGLLRCADVDGDGRADLIKLDGSGKVYTFLSNGDGPSDHLKAATFPYGATVTLGYTPSSRYQNQLLPFVLQALSFLEVDDGFGNLTTTRYSYAGGLFDFENREFRGFAFVSQTLAAATPHEIVTQTQFHQDSWFKGRAYEVVQLEPGENGALLSKATFTWDKQFLDPPNNTYAFVKLQQKLSESYDGETIYTKEQYSYDDTNGNLLSKTTSGTNGEDVTVNFAYANLGDWMWRKTRETLVGSVSGKVRESYNTYQSGTGNLISQEFWLNGGDNPKIEMTYDQYGNQKTVKDARGNITTTEYDPLAHTFPVKTIYPQTSGVTHIVENQSWDYRFGKVTISSDENGYQTYYSYDEFGRPAQVDSPNGGQVTTDYYDDEFPRYVVTKVKEDASGSTIDAYQYMDGLGREIQTITIGEDGKSVVFKKFYDALGRNDLVEGPFFSTEPEFPLSPTGAYPWQQTTFDLRGRSEAVESADGQYGSVVATFSYSGLSSTAIDPDGGSKTERKDYLGRVVEVIEHGDQQNYSTLYAYNAASDLLEVEDHQGNKTTIAYDTLGRKTSMNDPDMGYWEYTYDANGNLVTQVDEKLQTVSFTYDELNRVTSKTYSTSDPTVTYSYDNLTIPNGRGRLYSVATSQATTTYNAYDELGNVNSVSKTITGDAAVYTTQYEYDFAGKVTRTTYPDGTVVANTYYPGTGLLQAVKDEGSVELARLSDYEPSGKIGRIEYANGVYTDYTYDPESTRLTAIVTSRPGPAVDLQNKLYQYTPAGDIQKITDNVNNVEYQYSYDRLHRLIQESNTGAYDPISYSYDAIGNITAKTVGDTTLTFAYDQWHKHAVKSITLNGDVYTFGYDDNGNMTEAPDFTDQQQAAFRSITYNADNMPVRIHYENGRIALAEDDSTQEKSSSAKVVASCWIASLPGQADASWTVDFYYDGEGVRVKKQVLGGSQTYYIGAHYEVKDDVSTKYIFAGNLRVAMVKDAEVKYFHKDHLGSSTVMTDSSGGMLESTDFMPFGAMRDHTGAKVSDYKFTDQEFDVETGLYNYNARLYDPLIGRFISPDSIVQAPFDPQTLNRYAYARNNPLIYIDPSGLSFFGSIGDIFDNIWDAVEPFAGTFVHTTVFIGLTVLTPLDPFTANMIASAAGGAASGASQGGLEGALAGAFIGGSFGAFSGAFAGMDQMPDSLSMGISFGMGFLQNQMISDTSDSDGGSNSISYMSSDDTDGLWAAVRTAIQIADILPIPSAYYQIPMEIGAFTTTIYDIRIAEVSAPRKVAAVLVSLYGLAGGLQAIPHPQTVIVGTAVDLSAFVAVSYLLGEPYPGAPLIKYLRPKSKYSTEPQSFSDILWDPKNGKIKK